MWKPMSVVVPDHGDLIIVRWEEEDCKVYEIATYSSEWGLVFNDCTCTLAQFADANLCWKRLEELEE